MNTTDEPEVVLHGGAPVHQQLHDQIRDCILTNRLRPGEQLPTVRAVAVELAINPHAVAQAYAALEREGFVSTAEGSGTIVAGPAPTAEAGTPAPLEALCTEFLDRAARQGFTADDVLRTTWSLIHRRVPS